MTDYITCLVPEKVGRLLSLELDESKCGLVQFFVRSLWCHGFKVSKIVTTVDRSQCA
jgi:hypothetical protein